MNYYAILFDADGVLIKNKHLFSEWLSQEYGIPIKKMLPFFNGVFKLCGLGKADLKEELAKVVSDWGWQGTVDELVDFWLTKGTEIDTEMQTFVQSLHEQGMPLYLVTHQEKYRGEHLRTLFEGKIFDRVYYSAALGIAKGEKTFWEKVFEGVTRDVQRKKGIALEKESYLFIDDAAENIKDAAAFGLQTYQYTGDIQALREFLR